MRLRNELYVTSWVALTYLWRVAITRTITNSAYTQLTERVAGIGASHAVAGKAVGLSHVRPRQMSHRSNGGCNVGMERARRFRARACATL